jgi:hypothetical protein
MSSHRSRRAAAVDPRAAGRRRITGATTVSAVGGTALAVFFGSLFAQAFAAESAPKPAPVQAALTLPQKSHEKTAAPNAKHTAAPKPPAAAPQPAAGEPVGSSGGS